MKLTLDQAYGILNNQSELDGLKNDGALKFFRIIVLLENEFKAEFKAVQKAQKDKDAKELDRLARIEKEIDFEPITQQDLKEQGLLTVKNLRLFRAIIETSGNPQQPEPSEAEQNHSPTPQTHKKS